MDLSSLLTAATGASSVGIDVTSAVDAALYAARAPERQWQTQQTQIQSQQTALSSIQSAVSSLSADLTTLGDPSGAIAQKSATSNSTAVSATADASASVGTHLVAVQSLAVSASWYSSPLSSAKASLSSSSLQLALSNGSQQSFALGSNGSNSLNALAQAINSASLGIAASVVTDTTGSRLALVSRNTGAANNFTVTDQGDTAPSWVSASVASSATSLGASTISIGDGNNSVDLTIAAGSSLSSVADQINNSGLSLSASVVTDANGAHLSVTSSNGGNVAIGSDPTMLLTQSSVGADASLQVDGVPIQSASNTVTGAVAGVTLKLQGVTSGTQAALTVAADSSQINAALSQFLTDYNSALSLTSSQFTYSSSTSSQGALGSDAAVRSLQSALLNLTTFSSSTSTEVTSLASLGITVGDDGTLSLNQNTLDQALTSDPSAVQQFLQGSALNGFAAKATSQIALFSRAGTGILSKDASTLTQEYTSLGTEISDFESGYIASQKTVLTTMYSNAEIALQQLPTTLKQIQAEFTSNSSGS